MTRWLADWNILDLFDAVFCSGDEGVVKPDPVAFEVILKRLSLEAEEAVFIDDTASHVEAARKLGLQGIVFTTAEALMDDLGHILDAEQGPSEGWTGGVG